MDTLADEVLQLGALSDAGVVKQGRADLGHHLLTYQWSKQNIQIIIMGS